MRQPLSAGEGQGVRGKEKGPVDVWSGHDIQRDPDYFLARAKWPCKPFSHISENSFVFSKSALKFTLI